VGFGADASRVSWGLKLAKTHKVATTWWLLTHSRERVTDWLIVEGNTTGRKPVEVSRVQHTGESHCGYGDSMGAEQDFIDEIIPRDGLSVAIVHLVAQRVKARILNFSPQKFKF
jgi:hypothetical protein